MWIYLHNFLWSVGWERLQIIHVVYKQVQDIRGRQGDGFIRELEGEHKLLKSALSANNNELR